MKAVGGTVSRPFVFCVYNTDVSANLVSVVVQQVDHAASVWLSLSYDLTFTVGQYAYGLHTPKKLPLKILCQV